MNLRKKSRHLGSLEKFLGLDKMRDDEKIAFALSDLLNVMADLSKLARSYDSRKFILRWWSTKLTETYW